MANKDTIEVGDQFLIDIQTGAQFYDSPGFEVVERKEKTNQNFGMLVIEEMTDADDKAVFETNERPFIEALTTPLEERYKGGSPAPAKSKYGPVYLPDEFEEMQSAYNFENPFEL